MSRPLCKICRNPARIWKDLQFGTELFYCPDCEYLFKDATARVSPEKEKAIYLLHENTPENTGYVQMLQTFVEKAILPHGRHLRTALDFGCGPGPVLASLLDKQGYQARVYDPYFADRTEVLSRQYDLITATEVLEHLNSPLVELKKLAEILNPEGILAVMTLFHPNNETACQDWWYRRDPTHIGFFTPVTLKRIARLLGLDLLDHDDRRIAVFRKPGSRNA